MKTGIKQIFLSRIFSQCVKELVQFRRDRLTLGLAFLLPLTTLLIFGFSIRLEAKDIPLLVQNFDSGQISQRYVDRLFATNQFNPVPWDRSQPLEAVLDRSLAKAAVVIPPDFSDRIKRNLPSPVQVVVDGTDANNARVIKNSIKATTNAFLQTEGLIPQDMPISARTRLWFNPGRQEALYIVPGVYAVVLWIFPSLLSAIAMVREKEKGTILQVYASSLSAGELILGKSIAYLMVAMAMAACVMGSGALIFQLRFAADPTPFFVITPIYLWASVMFGLMLGARSPDQNSAVQGVSLIGFLTSFLLSGFIYPLSNIPFPLSLIPNVVAARYFIEVMRDTFVRGTGWGGVWFDLVMISAIGLVFFAVARRTMSRMQIQG